MNHFLNVDGLGLEEDQKQNMWLLSFQDNNMANFDLYVNSHNLPLVSSEIERVQNTNIIVPNGVSDLRTYTLEYRESVTFRIMQYHMAWFQGLYTPDRLVKKTFHNMKRNAIIKFISHPGSPTPNATFELINMQFVGFDDVQLGEDSGDPLTVSCTYEIEHIRPVFLNQYSPPK